MKAPRSAIKPQVMWIRLMVEALDDWRIEMLSQKLGVSYGDALLLLLRVWKHLYNEKGRHLPPEEIDSAAKRLGMADAMLHSKLAEARTDGLRVRGNEHAVAYSRSREARSESARERHNRERAAKESSGVQLGSAITPAITTPVPPPSSSSSTPDSENPDSGSALSTGTALLAGMAGPPGEKASGEAKKGPTAKKAVRPPKPPPDAFAATVRGVTDYWDSLWEAAQGGPYGWTQEQIFALRPCIKKLGPGEVQKRMHVMIKDPPEGVRAFLRGGPPTVNAFVACINSLATWSQSRAKTVQTEDDLLHDDGWRTKSQLRFSELRALAQRKVPAWWSEPERIALAKDTHGDPVIPLVPPGLPKDHSHVLKRLRQYIDQQNSYRSEKWNADEVDAWYRARFKVKD